MNKGDAAKREENIKSTFSDPLVWAGQIGEIVSSGQKRKYYRFRPAPFYGGIGTADCVGCCLKCLFCWSWHILINNPP